MRILKSTLLEAAGFRHGFSTRDVDLSLAAPAFGRDVVAFAAAAGLPGVPRQVNQVHGAAVARADALGPAERPDADALVARSVAVGVRVADCVPVLVADRSSGAVAAIHAGWKGYVAGVVAAGLDALGGGPWVAAVGPSIGPCCFEVGAEVADRIDGRAGGGTIVRRYVDAGGNGKARVDLRLAVERELAARRVEVDVVAGCTHCDGERFFSFRRGAEAGRLLAAIAPRGPG